MMVILT